MGIDAVDQPWFRISALPQAMAATWCEARTLGPIKAAQMGHNVWP